MDVRAKFSIRSLLLVTAAAAVVLAVVAQVPRDRLWAALRTGPALILFTALFAAVPLVCMNTICVAAECLLWRNRVEVDQQRRLRIASPQRLLWLPIARNAPPLGLGVCSAIVCTLSTALIWPLWREVGLGFALVLAGQAPTGRSIFASIPELLVDSSYLWRLFSWELFAFFRWWCFFGSLAVVGYVIARIASRWLSHESIRECFSRLLAFAPWIVVLEIAFLVGVWTHHSSVVPEPSTGFVEGIFSWDLWHWDCWKGAVWIQRGMLPVILVGSIFFAGVLRWRWMAAIPAAACCVPPALMLSIAWSVAW